jgi:Flagellar motor switch/type III secretory pathway protein
MTAMSHKSAALVNPEVMEKGSAVAKALLEGGSGGWATLVGKNVSYNISESDYGRVNEVLKDSDKTERVVTPVDWTGDNTGKVYLLVSTDGAKAVVAYMTALMLGGSANPAETQLDADGMDAYSEAVNTFFGQGAQQARGEIGGTIKTSIGATKIVDLSKVNIEEALGKDDLLCFKVSSVIEGNPPFDLILMMTRSVTGVPPDENDAASLDDAAAEASAKLGVDPNNLATAMRIKLPFIVNIATKKMRMELIQDMNPGTIIEFKKMSGEMLDVMAGNVKIAEAEVVITNQCFGVQIRSILDPRAVQPK